MKFAKEIEDDLVPEWRFKYLNYKIGKKKIKAISRALREAHHTPSAHLNAAPNSPAASPNRLPYTHYDFNTRQSVRPGKGNAAQQGGPASMQSARQRRQSMTMFTRSPPVMVPDSQPESQEESRAESRDESSDTTPESTPLQPTRSTRYGSFVGTPPDSPPALDKFQLPDPAMDPERSKNSQRRVKENMPPTMPSARVHSAQSSPSDPDPSPKTRPQPIRHDSWTRRLFSRVRNKSSQRVRFGALPKARLRKMFHTAHSPNVDDVQLEAYERLDARQNEFFNFLDSELNKVEDFYRSKENEASERLAVLRKQLHELRDRRLSEIEQGKNGGQQEHEDGVLRADLDQAHAKVHDFANGHTMNALKPIGNLVTGKPKVGRVSNSLQKYTSPQDPRGHRLEDRKDYVKRKDEAPTYRVAKRRLKLALQEFYRGLELVKSYTLLNRTAFRKINKKYDKAVNARPTLRYYSEKIEPAYFVRSDVIGSHMVAVEDLYARYFEKGNHKVAVGKLRSKLKAGDLSSVSFRNGLYVAAGSCLAVAGLVPALDRLFSNQGTAFVNTSYLLQLYGGYFLALLLFLLFVLDCKVWAANRVNYAFVFEYDPRHTFDWRQLAELPCFFLFLNGLFLYVNFRQNMQSSMYLYWPLVLIVITLIVMLLPVRVLYYQARRWWAYSNFRLFFAGIYPVEFRDFYLGDMYCSSTYAMSQIEIFFCLYVNDWSNPAQCGSNHSRLLGFFTAVPAVWRAFQCLRRFKDSGNWFPHLANCAKYGCNILYYMTLSLYRIDRTNQTRIPFIVFAVINAVYCSFWDIFMDWSLGNWWSSNWLLRNRLAFKRRRVYYAAMLADLVLRQQWIAFAIFTADLQHASAASFFVALAEVLRRGMWSLFRVENEHCNNVDNYRASRDIPLPYKLEHAGEDRALQQPPAEAEATGVDLERQPSTPSTLRRRAQTPTVRALQRVGTVIAAAHAQDFEKRRRPAIRPEDEDAMDGDESSEDEDEDDELRNERISREEDREDIHEAEVFAGRANR